MKESVKIWRVDFGDNEWYQNVEARTVLSAIAKARLALIKEIRETNRERKLMRLPVTSVQLCVETTDR